MKRTTAILLLVTLVGSACVLTSCTKEEKTIAGVVIGAAAGAGIGAAAGNTEGAIAGGLLGGAAGGLIGHSLGDDKKDDPVRDGKKKY